MSQLSTIALKSDNSIVIDLKQDSVISDHASLQSEIPVCQSETSADQAGEEDGKIYQQGRWTQYEHLIFLACIIHFGRDWKKIEYHVQTRSSSQARSHAQKVLKKMDRNAIMREIRQIKNKLDFDPKIHKWENLSVLTIEGDNWRDIPGLMPARYRRSKKNKQASTPQVKVEFQILRNAQKDLNQENKQVGVSSLLTPDSKGSIREFKTCPTKQMAPRSHMVTRGKALAESFKSSDLINTPQSNLFREAGTPSTCASSKVSPLNLNAKFNAVSKDADASVTESKTTSTFSCSKNLNSRMEEFETQSKDESDSKSTCDTPSEEVYFDFDFQPFLRNDKVDIEFENLMSLNSIQAEHKAFSSSEFSVDDQWIFGDSMMPLSALY